MLTLKSTLIVLAVVVIAFLPFHSLAIALSLFAVLLFYRRFRSSDVISIAVVVLGDVGRSPRMQNHALAIRRILKAGQPQNTTSRYRVVLAGYKGSKCCSEIELDSNIDVIRINDPVVDQWRSKFLYFGSFGFLIFAILKIIDSSVRLCYSLIRVHNLRLVIVQNPPTFPTIPLMWTFCRIFGMNFVVDWHNYGTSILALSPSGRRFCAISKFVEKHFGSMADHAFCVSDAMRTDLISNWGVSSSRLSLLYDKPPPSFHPLSLIERHEILYRYFPFGCGPFTESVDTSDSVLSPLVSGVGGSTQIRNILLSNSQMTKLDSIHLIPSFTKSPIINLEFSESVKDEISMFTSLTCLSDSCMVLKHLPDRPALIVTSTSWTPDEDLDLLLDSICLYEARMENTKAKIPRLVLVVTGLGPGRLAWLEKAANKNLKYVTIRSVFLPFSDYWRLIGSSDLGICLHRSSSGLDLPMKAVDMRGVAVPILAVNFHALSELVIPGLCGEVFTTAEELTDQLVCLLSGFPNESHELTKLRLSSENSILTNWDIEWSKQALPPLRQLLNS